MPLPPELCARCGHDINDHIEEDDCCYCVACMKVEIGKDPHLDPLWVHRYHKFAFKVEVAPKGT